MPMRTHRRGGFAPSSTAAIELLEARILLSATPAITAAQASVVSRLAAAPNVNASTTPNNGDGNPYGVAFVPQGVASGGKLHAGDILVSNFNNGGGKQGTGSTIVEIAPNGAQTLFFQGPKGMNLGLTTALGVLKNGYVLVGNVPTTDGTFSTIEQGSLLVLNKNGQIVANLKDPVKLDGPWDLTLVDLGNTAVVFVSNVLNGTVTRLILSVPSSGSNVKVLSSVTIGSGYSHAPNGPALIVGPTGLAFNPFLDLLYVASTDDNTIYAIPAALIRPSSAGKGIVIFHDNAVLRGPLGLVLLPDGNLITANGDAINSNANQPSELVEFTPTGQFVGETSIDGSEGGAFGIAAEIEGNDLVFAAVDDNSNSLLIWDLPI
jgi:hypothetical protein